MRIQPITVRTSQYYNRTKKVNAEPEKQPNFKGIKGFLKGGTVGAGITAAGVALIAGVAALPVFASYIVINGALAAASGHLIENQNKKDDK